MPISFVWASAEKREEAACWPFQPKRPIRWRPGGSSTGLDVDAATPSVS